MLLFSGYKSYTCVSHICQDIMDNMYIFPFSIYYLLCNVNCNVLFPFPFIWVLCTMYPCTNYKVGNSEYVSKGFIIIILQFFSLWNWMDGWTDGLHLRQRLHFPNTNSSPSWRSSVVFLEAYKTEIKHI